MITRDNIKDVVGQLSAKDKGGAICISYLT